MLKIGVRALAAFILTVLTLLALLRFYCIVYKCTAGNLLVDTFAILTIILFGFPILGALFFTGISLIVNSTYRRFGRILLTLVVGLVVSAATLLSYTLTLEYIKDMIIFFDIIIGLIVYTVLISVVFNFMSLVIVKFVSGAKESEKSSLFNYFYKKMVIPGMLFGMLLLVLSNPIAGFLKIDFKIDTSEIKE